jgi:hypothetical protein
LPDDDRAEPEAHPDAPTPEQYAALQAEAARPRGGGAARLKLLAWKLDDRGRVVPARAEQDAMPAPQHAPLPPALHVGPGGKTDAQGRARPRPRRVERDEARFPLDDGLALVRALDDRPARLGPRGVDLVEDFAAHFAGRWRDAEPDFVGSLRAAAMNLGAGQIEAMVKECEAARIDAPSHYWPKRAWPLIRVALAAPS